MSATLAAGETMGDQPTARGRPGTARLVRALACTELCRLTKNPFLWCATAAALALPTLLSLRQPMVANLEYETQLAGTGALLLAVALMVTANLGTARDRRRGMPETLAALPAGPSVRTLAALLACGLAAGALTTVTIGAHLLLRLNSGPVVANLNPWEVVAAVEGSVVLTVLGVALARWVPTLLAVPVVLVVFVALTVDQGTTVWPLPFTSLLAGELLWWPAGSRSAYLAALAALLAAVALLRHGRRRARAAAAVVSLALLMPLLASGVAAAHEHDDTSLSCTDRAGVRYCHLPGFAPWVPLWAEAATPVAVAVPRAERGAVPVVTQYRTTLTGAQGDGLVGTEWGRGEVARDYQRVLAGELATRVTGLHHGARCSGAGQARTVLALWLAGQAVTPPAAPSVDEMGHTALGDVTYTRQEGQVARALLRKDDAGRRIAAHWRTLVRPETDLHRARPLLGLSGPKSGRTAGQLRGGGKPCR